MNTMRSSSVNARCAFGSTRQVGFGCAIVLSVVLGGCRNHSAWTVLNEQAALQLMNPCSREFPQEVVRPYWAPTAPELAVAEEKLSELVRQQAAFLSTDQRRNLPTGYYRQYVGLTRQGRRVIYLNAISRETADWEEARKIPPSWRDGAHNVCDGGLSSFGAVFDPAVRAFDWFQFNGTVGSATRPRIGSDWQETTVVPRAPSGGQTRGSSVPAFLKEAK